MTIEECSPKSKLDCLGASQKAPHFALSSDESGKNQSTKSEQKENGAYCVRPLPLIAPLRPIRWHGRGRPLVDFGIGGCHAYEPDYECHHVTRRRNSCQKE